MVRQSTTPVVFDTTIRADDGQFITSGRAGEVVPVTYFPVLRGDSCGGQIGLDVELGHMPKPTLNGVMLNAQAWFVPDAAHPRYASYQEFFLSYQEEPIKQLGATDRAAPKFFDLIDGAVKKTFLESKFCKTLGIHAKPTGKMNTALYDAYNIVHNFRLRSHSTRLPLRKYAAEDISLANTFPPAFWPSGPRSRMVPDYDRALVVGAMNLDVSAGNVIINDNATINVSGNKADRESARWRSASAGNATTNAANGSILSEVDGGGRNSGVPRVDNGAGTPAQRQQVVYDPVKSLFAATKGLKADFSGSSIASATANIDKARLTQSFAQMAAAYAGLDTTGFKNANALIAELMQGFSVPDDEQYRRPWLLDSKIVSFGMLERMATDGGNLDMSSTQGRASVVLSVNLPVQQSGGYVIVIVEVLPERIDERSADYILEYESPKQFPDALRDVQRIEPVDQVLKERIDALHTTPTGLYGWEPMNERYNRNFTRLGGDFYQATVGEAWREARSNLWLPEFVDPEFNASHYLAPSPFPHDVFSDVNASAFEVVGRQNIRIAGITQFGDVLAENNGEWEAVTGDNE